MHAEGGGGHNKVLGSFNTAAGGFSRSDGWAQKVLPCHVGGGGQNVLDPRLSYFVAPPPPPCLMTCT